MLKFLCAVFMATQSHSAECLQSLSEAKAGQFFDRGQYSFYVPNTFKKSAGLVVYLHGCKQPMLHSRKVTKLEEHADREGFIVVYPEQSLLRNGYKCWNWFLSANTERNGPEPALIVSAVQEIQNEYKTDRKKTFVMLINVRKN